MTRIRTIKPGFFRSRSLAKCARDARLTFAGLWTEADDFGNGVADTRILKGAIWPLDDDVTFEEVEWHLQQLQATGHVLLYEVDDERYFHVVNWEEHQAAAYRRGSASCPPPPEHDSHDEACKKVQGARFDVLEGKGREGIGGDAGAARTRTRGARVSEDFEPNGNHRVFAEKNGLDLDHELAQFISHHTAKGSVMKDWDAAFWTWLRNAKKWGHTTTAQAAGFTSLL